MKRSIKLLTKTCVLVAVMISSCTDDDDIQKLRDQINTDEIVFDINDEPFEDVAIRVNTSFSGLDAFDLENAEVLDVPVTFHVVNNNSGFGALDQSALNAGLNDLNRAYAGAKLNFVQCGEPNVISDANLYNHTKSNETFGDSNDVPNTINIYIPRSITNTSGSTIAGYAFFPFETKSRIYVIRERFSSSTLPHEIGHYLSLYHTHSTSGRFGVSGSGCNTEGDGVCDTPFDPRLADGRNVIGAPDCTFIGNLDPAPLTNNIMSYAPQRCRDMFTPEQLKRAAFSARNHWDFNCN